MTVFARRHLRRALSLTRLLADPTTRCQRLLPPVAALTLLCLAIILSSTACRSASPETVVVYTSVDQVISEPVLKEFEAASGVKVEAVYDVEAAKTTGLVSRLLAERSRPRADVFWSSEFAQTIFLKGQGVLEAYRSPSAAEIPAEYRDPDGHWTGFGARARVILVNTDLVQQDKHPRSIFQLADGTWGEGEVAIANPLFGTTATHAAALFAQMGDQKAAEFFRSLLQRKVMVVDGNSVVRDMVVRGEVKAGLTDTDDAHEAIAKGAHVRMIIPDQDADHPLGTLVIPNTAAIVKGGPHPSTARKLIDYLTSAELESRLARSGSLQMPVRRGVSTPAEVPALSSLKPMRVSLQEIADRLPFSSQWLRENFLR